MIKGGLSSKVCFWERLTFWLSNKETLQVLKHSTIEFKKCFDISLFIPALLSCVPFSTCKGTKLYLRLMVETFEAKEVLKFANEILAAWG